MCPIYHIEKNEFVVLGGVGGVGFMGGWVGVVGGRVGRDGVVKNSRNFPGNFFRFSGSSQEISRKFPLVNNHKI